jgi:hypothetical protein
VAGGWKAPYASSPCCRSALKVSRRPSHGLRAEAVINGRPGFPIKVSPRNSAFASRMHSASRLLPDGPRRHRGGHGLAFPRWRRCRAADQLIDICARYEQRVRLTWRSAQGGERILEDLAGALHVPVSSGTDVRRAADCQLAYRTYLGAVLWNQRSEPSLHSAIVQFRRAIK